MKKIKMPLNFRLQNFFFDGDRILWTSASKTIKQKIVRWWNNDDRQLCNTSEGYTIESHGQNTVYEDEVIKHKNTPHKIWKITKHLKYQEEEQIQGYSSDYKYVVTGHRGKGFIKVYDIYKNSQTTVINRTLFYPLHKKWWWKEWAADGIEHKDGKIYVGISVKSKFGFILNYIKEV
jgi:hypothetical protein